MFLGIDRDAWISIWAGGLGAIPAAVISAAVAAWVAVKVLNRSNKHQQKLAAEAIAHQKELGERQLEEQRAEAARSREHAAVADVLTSVESLHFVNRSSLEAVSAQVSIFMAAIARWRVEMGKSPMERELREWSVLLIGAVGERTAAEELGDEEREGTREHMTDVAAELINVALQWPSASAETRVLMQKHLTEARARQERRRGNVPEATPVP